MNRDRFELTKEQLEELLDEFYDEGGVDGNYNPANNPILYEIIEKNLVRVDDHGFTKNLVVLRLSDKKFFKSEEWEEDHDCNVSRWLEKLPFIEVFTVQKTITVYE